MYSADDAGWLEVCVILRASGMPLGVLRRYTDLVRAGEGNEQQRLDLLRTQQSAVADQIRALAEAKDLIDFKVGIYEDIIDAASSEPPR